MRGSNNGGDPMFIDYRWKLHGIVGQGDSQSDHDTVGICPTCGARTFTTPRDSAHSRRVRRRHSLRRTTARSNEASYSERDQNANHRPRTGSEGPSTRGVAGRRRRHHRSGTTLVVLAVIQNGPWVRIRLEAGRSVSLDRNDAVVVQD